MGTSELASMSLLESLEGLFIQFFLGLGTASSVLLGNDLGAGRKEEAYEKSKAFLILVPFLGLVAGTLMTMCASPLLALYENLDAETRRMSIELFMIMGAALFIKIFNMMSMFGILRSGGDTRYMMFIDIVCMWGIGVPMAVFAALFLDLPLHWVYIFVLSEELIKAIWSFNRIQSRKWLRSLVD